MNVKSGRNENDRRYSLYDTRTRSIMTRMQMSQPKGNSVGCGLRKSGADVSFNLYRIWKVTRPSVKPDGKNAVVKLAHCARKFSYLSPVARIKFRAAAQKLNPD